MPPNFHLNPGSLGRAPPRPEAPCLCLSILFLFLYLWGILLLFLVLLGILFPFLSLNPKPWLEDGGDVYSGDQIFLSGPLNPRLFEDGGLVVLQESIGRLD